MSGPLPSPGARRRNAPTIPTTNLPIGGRRNEKGARLRAPALPTAYTLGPAGKAWWTWAWATPQAAAWDPGSLYALARRARLEDDVAELRAPPQLSLEPLVEAIAAGDTADPDAIDALVEHVRYVIGVLKSLAGQKATIEREARELDDRFGLTPKGLAALRWKIVDDVEQKPAATEGESPAPVRRLRAVDPSAATG